MKVAELCRQELPNYIIDGKLIMGKIAIAREIKKKYKLKQPVDIIRTALRTITGTCGKNKGVILPGHEGLSFDGLPIPDSFLDNEVWNLPSYCERVLIIPDLHLPYHDLEKLKLMFTFMNGRFDSILLLGDNLDCYSMSKFTKDPRYKKFNEEKKIWFEFVAWLKFQFPKVKLIFKVGNHEERIQSRLLQNAPEFSEITDSVGTRIFDFESIMQFKENNIEYVSGRRLMKLGKMNAMHGQETSVAVGVNPARNLYLKAQDHFIKGHSHISSSYISRHGIECYTLGMMGNMKVCYDSMPNWTNGFGFIEVDHKTGNFNFENYMFKNERIIRL